MSTWKYFACFANTGNLNRQDVKDAKQENRGNSGTVTKFVSETTLLDKERRANLVTVPELPPSPSVAKFPVSNKKGHP